MFNQTTPGISSSEKGVTYNLNVAFQDDGGLVEIARIKDGKIDTELRCPIQPNAPKGDPTNLIILRSRLRRAGILPPDVRRLLQEFVCLARKCQATSQGRRVLVTAT